MTILALAAAALIIMLAMYDYRHKPVCVRCGGKGQHKPNCPFDLTDTE